MVPTLGEKIAAAIVAIPAFGGLLTLFPEILTYSGNPTNLLWRLIFVAAIASGGMYWVGSHVDDAIAATFTLGTWGGVMTIGWHLIVNYSIPEPLAIVIAILASTVGTMAVVILVALIEVKLQRKIAGPSY